MIKSPSSALQGLSVSWGLDEPRVTVYSRCCVEVRHRKLTAVLSNKDSLPHTASPQPASTNSIWPEFLRANISLQRLYFCNVLLLSIILDSGRDVTGRQKEFCVWMHTCIFSFVPHTWGLCLARIGCCGAVWPVNTPGRHMKGVQSIPGDTGPGCFPPSLSIARALLPE